MGRPHLSPPLGTSLALPVKPGNPLSGDLFARTAPGTLQLGLYWGFYLLLSGGGHTHTWGPILHQLKGAGFWFPPSDSHLGSVWMLLPTPCCALGQGGGSRSLLLGAAQVRVGARSDLRNGAWLLLLGSGRPAVYAAGTPWRRQRGCHRAGIRERATAGAGWGPTTASRLLAPCMDTQARPHLPSRLQEQARPPDTPAPSARPAPNPCTSFQSWLRITARSLCQHCPGWGGAGMSGHPRLDTGPSAFGPQQQKGRWQAALRRPQEGLGLAASWGGL